MRLLKLNPAELESQIFCVPIFQVQDPWAEGLEEAEGLSVLWENLYNIITLQFVNHPHGANRT